MSREIREICGECMYHDVHDRVERLTGDAWMCHNEDSDYYCDYTQYNDSCEEFVERGID